MSAWIVLDVTDCHQWEVRPPIYSETVRMPQNKRPTVIQLSREQAEREAVRLAVKTGGRFAVFELAGVVKGRVLNRGEPMIGAGPGGLHVPQWEDPATLP